MSTKATALAFFVVWWFGPLADSHAQTTQCVQPPAGLVSWWPGDGNTTDIADGNNGSLQDTATFTSGTSGQAFNFDGAEGAVVIGNPANLMLQTFSIEAWIKRASSTQASAGPGGGCIYCYGINNFGFLFADDGRLFLTRVSIDGDFSSSVQVNDTAFHHVAVTKSGTTVKFYVDGVEEVAPPYVPVFEFTTNAAIGARGDISFPTGLQFNVFLGAIDELAIYNRVLTAAEVQAIFNAGSAGKCAVQGPSFGAFSAQATLHLGPLAADDRLALRSTFSLGEESDGIHPLTEDVRIQVGSFSTVIPAGSFQSRPNGAFVFEGVIDGVTLKANLTPPRGNGQRSKTFGFDLDGRGADLAGTVLPIGVSLTIGDDHGQLALTDGDVAAQSKP
jgi:hypothetical protein